MRCNRVGKAVLPEKMKKGEYTFQFDENNEVLVIRWRDNANVTVLSNFDTVEPLGHAKRYDRNLHSHVHHKVPHAITEYNSYMGGVDLHDNALSNYRIGIRGKKWWWPLFKNTLGSMMVNAWKLHQTIAKHTKQKPMSQLTFRSMVTRTLLASDDPDKEATESTEIASNYGSESSEMSTRSSILPNVNTKNHFPERNPDGKRKRCKVCHSQCMYTCKKCGVHLHTHCFKSYESHQ